MAEKRALTGEKVRIEPSKNMEAIAANLKTSKPLRLGKDCDYEQELGRLQI